jgi:hypothetical protein
LEAFFRSLLKSNISIAGKAALQIRQLHAPACLPNAQKAQKSCFFLQNPCHLGTKTGSFYTDFPRAILCFHRFTGFGRKKIRNPFSGILQRKHSPVPQGHVVFRQAKYLDQLSKQRVGGLGGSQSRLGRLDNRAGRGIYQGQQEVTVEARAPPAPQAIQPRLRLAPRRARPSGFLSVVAVGLQAGGSHGGLAQKHDLT